MLLFLLHNIVMCNRIMSFYCIQHIFYRFQCLKYSVSGQIRVKVQDAVSVQASRQTSVAFRNEVKQP